MNLYSMTALELGALLKRGDCTVEEAAEAARSRRDALQPVLNSFITFTEPDLSLIHPGASPLAGVPMAWKDNLCTSGIRTTCASRMLSDFIPPYSATAVTRLTAAGAAGMGKLNMDEFAMGSTSEHSFFGPVRNPWNTDRVAGGSSGGSAAAVASGQVWYSLGSDTGGSIRLPASYCGITGMKPSYGVVSRYGLIAHASSLDQIGPMARSAADCAAVLDLLRGRDPMDGTTADLPGAPVSESLTGDLHGVRIGIPAESIGEWVQDEIRQAVSDTADVLKERGASVEFCSFPLLHYVSSVYSILSAAEASSNLARYDGIRYGHRAEGCTDLTDLYARSRGEGFGSLVKYRILRGILALSEEGFETCYLPALRVRGQITQQLKALFKKFDLLLTPATPTTAPLLCKEDPDPAQAALRDDPLAAANLAGLPALSMPCGFDKAGLPMGVQLMGDSMQDALVLNAAHGFQMETRFHLDMPHPGGDSQ